MDGNTHDDDRIAQVVKKLESERNNRSKRNFVSSNPELKGISTERKRKRRVWIENGVKWGMSVEQIAKYTEAMGDKVSKRQVYDYLSDMKLPKYYDKSGRTQHLHDYMCFETFLRIAVVLRETGLSASVVQFDQTPGDGARFRHDFKFRVERYLFYGEVQLSDIAGTNWRKKHKDYLRWYEIARMPFRVLMIVDQKRDMSTIRAHAREVLRDRPELNLFLYCTLNDLNESNDVVRDRIWRDKNGERHSLIE